MVAMRDRMVFMVAFFIVVTLSGLGGVLPLFIFILPLFVENVKCFFFGVFGSTVAFGCEGSQSASEFLSEVGYLPLTLSLYHTLGGLSRGFQNFFYYLGSDFTVVSGGKRSTVVAHCSLPL